jgi:hypothetical protein
MKAYANERLKATDRSLLSSFIFLLQRYNRRIIQPSTFPGNTCNDVLGKFYL